MRIFFDTSVFISVFWGGHPGHAASLELLSQATPADSFCGIHTLAEVYANLTAMPIRPVIAPEQAALCIQTIRERCSPVVLTEAEYAATIERTAVRGFKSGMIYAALLLSCAEKAQSEIIYTWDIKHFRMIGPQLADRIRTP
jgi:predicted nucleic acid-binding protein